LDELFGALGADPMQSSADDEPSAPPTRQAVSASRAPMPALDAERETAGRI
jgi:hypothetical protein